MTLVLPLCGRQARLFSGRAFREQGSSTGVVPLRYSLTVIVIVIGFRGLSNSSRWAADRVYYIHPPKDFAEDGVGAVQPTGVREVDMALL